MSYVFVTLLIASPAEGKLSQSIHNSSPNQPTDLSSHALARPYREIVGGTGSVQCFRSPFKDEQTRKAPATKHDLLFSEPPPNDTVAYMLSVRPSIRPRSAPLPSSFPSLTLKWLRCSVDDDATRRRLTFGNTKSKTNGGGEGAADPKFGVVVGGTDEGLVS